MAKNKKESTETKLYELGEGATLFVDQITGKKVAGTAKVEFTAEERRTDRFKTALKNGHLQEAEPDEVEDEDEEDPNAEAKAKFAKLNVADKKKFLLDEFELDEDDKAEIDGLKAAELNEKYAELLDESEDSE